MAPLRQSVPSLSPSANIPGLGEALREHFDRAPVGILLFGNDRRIVAANGALAKVSGIAAGVFSGGRLRGVVLGGGGGGVGAGGVGGGVGGGGGGGGVGVWCVVGVVGCVLL